MKAEELRIGNLVYLPSKAVYAVDVLYRNYDMLKVWEPIPLTEEWLHKFCFVKQLRMYYPMFSTLCHKSKTYFTVSQQTEYEDPNELSMKDLKSWWVMQGNNHGLKIEYVHQLQNLYFCLTGEELTLK